MIRDTQVDDTQKGMISLDNVVPHTANCYFVAISAEAGGPVVFDYAGVTSDCQATENLLMHRGGWIEQRDLGIVTGQ
jgi:hypothetical protein